MGSCFSRTDSDYRYPVAKVISVDGELHEYAVPVTVSYVLDSEGAGAPAPPASSSKGIFICDSDRLYYEEHFPALDPGDELVGDQIYFVLPESRLDRRVRAPEMAALAVKASLALQKAVEKRRGGVRRRRKSSVRISPVLEAQDEGVYNEIVMNGGYGRASITVRRSVSISRDNSRVARSGSFRKTGRVVSHKRGKIVGSLRVRLSTIYEET